MSVAAIERLTEISIKSIATKDRNYEESLAASAAAIAASAAAKAAKAAIKATKNKVTNKDDNINNFNTFFDREDNQRMETEDEVEPVSVEKTTPATEKTTNS